VVQARKLEEAMLRPLMVAKEVARAGPVSPKSALLGGGLTMAVGASGEETEAGSAALAAWRAMEGSLGGPATFAFVFCQSSLESKVVASALRTPAEAACVIGGSSNRGALTPHGLGRVGILGLRGLAWHCGIGCSSGAASSSHARLAGAAATRKAMKEKKGHPPDLIFICVAPGQEELVLKGIGDVAGRHVPIFGGSAADESSTTGTTNDAWWQLCGSLAGWECLTDGVVVAALWLYGDAGASCLLSHCFAPTESTGLVTKASGRFLGTIGGRPAARVLNEWTGGALQRVLSGGPVPRWRSSPSPWLPIAPPSVESGGSIGAMSGLCKPRLS